MSVSVENFEGRRTISSPRSLEACAALGVLPQELISRTLDSFKEVGGVNDDWAVKMRYDRYEQKRKDTVSAVKKQRRSVTSPGSRSQAGGGYGAGSNVDETASMMKREQMALEKLQRKQQQEIEQMIAYEVKMAEIAQQQRDKEEKERVRFEKHQAEVAQRKAEFEQQRKEKEERKRIAALEAEEEAKQKAAAEHRREQEFAEAQRKKAVQAAKEARQRDQEAKERQEQHKRETEAIIAKQQAEVEERRRMMEKKEAERVKAMEEEQRIVAAERATKRKIAADRISAAQAQQAVLLKEQQAEFARKEADAEKRRIAFEQELEQQHAESRRQAQRKREEIEMAIANANAIAEERKNVLVSKEQATNKRLADLEVQKQRDAVLRGQQIKQKQADRAAAKKKAEDDLESRKQQIVAHRSEVDKVFGRVQAQREKDLAMKREESRLKHLDIQENVERQRRQREYQKHMTLEKMAADEEKTKALEAKRAQIAERRKQVAQNSTRARQELQGVMEQMRKKSSSGGALKLPDSLLKQAGIDSDQLKKSLGANNRRQRTESAPQQRPATTSSKPRAASTQRQRPSTASVAAPAPEALGLPTEVIPRRAAPARSVSSAKSKTRGVGSAQSRQTVEELPKARVTSSTRGLATTSARGSRDKQVNKKSTRAGGLSQSAGPSRRKGSKSAGGSMIRRRPNMSQAEAQGLVEELRRRQNEDLLLVLEQEQRNETEREMTLANMNDPAQRRETEHLFGIERAKASERIMQITAEHEAILANHMQELGLLDKPQAW